MKNPRNFQNRNALRGFTLVELLVVVTIIVVLSSLVVGISGFAQGKAAVSKATVQMKLMEAKLDEYAQDVGGLPEEEDETGLILYSMLFGDGIGTDGIVGTADDGGLDGKPDEGAKVYLPDLDPNTNKQGMLEIRDKTNPIPTKVVDPWGNAWHYRSGESFNPRNPDFDIWSFGPDGRENTEDDIQNW